MSTQPTMRSHPELVDELSAWLVAGGVLTMALFPLALPFLLLTVVAALPFLVVPPVAGLIAAVVAAPILLARALGRWLFGALRRADHAHRRARGAPAAS
jgi:hypothetical protein